MTSRRSVRTAVTALLSAAALVGAGCEKHHVTTEASTEGIWVDVGPLDYHIQGSRILEDRVDPDRSYLTGLPVGVEAPAGDEIWFSVFLRIENKTDAPAPTAREFEIVDTDGTTFAPVGLDSEANPFAYVPTTLAPTEVVPKAGSAQDLNSFAGAELLFKLPLSSYQNRPLTLRIHSPDGTPPEEAEIDLDV